METLREIFISLGLEVDEAGFATALSAEKLLEKATEKLVEVLKEIPAFFAEAVKSTAEYGHAAELGSVRTGLSVEAFQELGYAATATGSSVETLETGMTRLARKMFDATQGNAEAALAFGRLGVSVTDGQGHLRDREAVLGDVAEAIKKLPNPTERAAAALKVFDRSGVSLLPMLSKGRDGIAALRQEAHDMGNVMDEDAIKSAAEFGHVLEVVKFTVQGLIHDLAGPLIEALLPVVDEFKAWFIANREIIKQRIQDVARGIAAAFRALLGVLVTTGKVLAWVVQNWRFFAVVAGAAVIAALATMKISLLELLVPWALNIACAIAYGAASIAAAVKSAAAWALAAAPAVLLTAVLVLMALAADDVYETLKGNEHTLLNELGPAWTSFLQRFTEHKGDDPWWVQSLKEGLRIITDLEGALRRLQLWFQEGGVKNFLIGTGFIPPGGLGAPQQGLDVVDLVRSMAARQQAGPQTAADTIPPYLARDPAQGAKVQATFHITTQPGQNAQEVAAHVERQWDQWWNDKMRETGDAASGG